MSNITIVEISKKELEEGEIPSNYVLVEATDSAYGAKTKAGIIYGFDTEKTFADADNPNNESHAADLCIPYGKVYKVPSGLYYNENDNTSMAWETDMELKVGDMVWFSIIESNNATTLSCEGVLYKFIPYSDIYVAKRTTISDRNEIFMELAIHGKVKSAKEEIIVLNGYVLIQPKKKIKLSDFDTQSEHELDLTRGTVCYLGKPNKRHKQPTYVDHTDLNVGDDVVLAPKAYPFWLERKRYMSRFNEEELYLVVPRRKVALAI
jgi:hypothetical protein